MKRLGIILATAALVVTGAFLVSTAYASRWNDTGGVAVPQVYSPNRLMLELWSAFKKNALETGTGRTIQKDLNGDSTATGQALTMQRAAWMDDLTTFEASWQWTKDNLQTDDYHFSTSFGELVNGNYGVKDTSTSAGADANMAYALIQGSARWREGKYLWDSRPITAALWRDHVRVINGREVFVSTAATATEPAMLKPVDFAPYIFRTLAKVDPSHDWAGVMNNTYDLLLTAQTAYPGQLPQSEYAIIASGDSLALQAVAGSAANPSGVLTNTDLRAIQYLTLDSKWYNDPRDRVLLSSYKPLQAYYKANGALVAAYKTDGTADSVDETPATYGMALGYFMLEDKEAAAAMYRKNLLTLYNPDIQSWKSDMGYNNDTWAWLGIALYNDGLPNIGGLYE